MNKRTKIPKMERATRTAPRYLTDSPTLALRLQRLARAIAAAPGQPSPAPLSHAACEALLEFYVDHERRAEEARALYPAVWEHLQTCARCRESYDLAKAALADAAPDSISTRASIPALPFLIRADETTAWSKQVRSRVGGAPLGFGFIIQPQHLQRLFAPAPAARLRGAAAPTERALLLSDTVNLGQRNALVEMWVHRFADSPEGRLEIFLVSSSPLPEPLHVTLRWNDQQHSEVIVRGHCAFDHLPIAELENARDLRVEFAEQSDATTEGGHGDPRAPA